MRVFLFFYGKVWMRSPESALTMTLIVSTFIEIMVTTSVYEGWGRLLCLVVSTRHSILNASLIRKGGEQLEL